MQHVTLQGEGDAPGRGAEIFDFIEKQLASGVNLAGVITSALVGQRQNKIEKDIREITMSNKQTRACKIHVCARACV